MEDRWINIFVKAKKVRRWPRFWVKEWVLPREIKFLQQIDLNSLILIETFQKDVVQLWARKLPPMSKKKGRNLSSFKKRDRKK